MRTIICKFNSEGSLVKKTAILNDFLDDLSNSKKNQATDILGPEWFDNKEWSVIFSISDSLAYEIVFKYDNENHIKTLEPLRAVTWGGDDANIVIDSQKVTVNYK